MYVEKPRLHTRSSGVVRLNQESALRLQAEASSAAIGYLILSSHRSSTPYRPRLFRDLIVYFSAHCRLSQAALRNVCASSCRCRRDCRQQPPQTPTTTALYERTRRRHLPTAGPSERSFSAPAGILPSFKAARRHSCLLRDGLFTQRRCSTIASTHAA